MWQRAKLLTTPTKGFILNGVGASDFGKTFRHKTSQRLSLLDSLQVALGPATKIQSNHFRCNNRLTKPSFGAPCLNIWEAIRREN